MTAEALTGLKAIIDALDLYAPANIGPLPVGNGIAIYPGPGSSADFLDRGMITEMTLVVNTKHQDQQTAVAAQDAINNALTIKGMTYPAGDGWAITTIDGTTPPQYTGVQDTGEYLWSSVLRVEIYSRGATKQ